MFFGEPGQRRGRKAVREELGSKAHRAAARKWLVQEGVVVLEKKPGKREYDVVLHIYPGGDSTNNRW